MQWRNDLHRYGMVAVALHWVTALLVFGLFALGLYMTNLTYYDPLYRVMPAIHKSAGIVLLTIVLLRLAWRRANPPTPVAQHSPLERRAARVVHAMTYLLLLALAFSGYLIATADGKALVAFGVPLLPSMFSADHLEDAAGAVHLALAVILMSLVAIHASAALKHHFVDRDRTLLRMLGR
jgi:cytochrome b561